MDYRYSLASQVSTVSIEPAGDAFAVTVNGATHLVHARLRAPGELELGWPDGRRLRAFVVADGDRRWVSLDPAPECGPVELMVPTAAARRRHGRGGGHDTLEAQMPGVVRQVLAAVGEAVARGQPLVLLEAMKMELRVTAPHAGRVERVAVAEGASVQRGQVLVELAAADEGLT